MQADTRDRLIRIEEQVNALREEMRKEFDWRDQNLKLQALEYERRLKDLNGEQARIAKSQEAHVSIDKYTGFRDEVLRTLSELKGRTGGMRQLIQTVLSVIAILVALYAAFKK